MTTDPLNDLWNSPPNRPEADAGERLASHFVDSLRKRRRFQAWWLAWTFFALTGVTTVAVLHVVSQGPAGVAGQWAMWPMLALPWSVALIFLRRFRQERVAASLVAPSLLAALLSALAGNRAERRRVVGVGVLLLVTAPMSALAIWQLRLAGKATTDQAWSMALVFGAALMLGGGFVLSRYRHHLVPEGRKIEALLGDLASSANEK